MKFNAKIRVVWKLRLTHDDVIKWKYFPRYRPFVRGVPGEFPSQKIVMRSIDIFFDLCLSKRLSKQSNHR